MRRALGLFLVTGSLLAMGWVSGATAQSACPPEPIVEVPEAEGLRVVHGAPIARVEDPAREDASLVLTLAQPSSVRPGEPLRLAIAARNDGDAGLRVAREGGVGGVDLRLYLEDDRGTVFDDGPRGLGCGVGGPDPLRILRLRAGESISEAFVMEARIARTGTYRAWIVYRRCQGTLFRGVTASNPVSIEIRGAPYTLGAAALAIETTEVHGALSREDARAATERARGTLSSCFTVSDGRVSAGTVIAEWRVGDAGTVTAARIAGGSLADPRIQGCILREVRHLSYPASTPTRIRQVISLAPLDARGP